MARAGLEVNAVTYDQSTVSAKRRRHEDSLLYFYASFQSEIPVTLTLDFVL